MVLRPIRNSVVRVLRALTLQDPLIVDPMTCHGCGYHLKGLPRAVGQRCPECGIEIARHPADPTYKPVFRPIPLVIRLASEFQLVLVAAMVFTRVFWSRMPAPAPQYVYDWPDRCQYLGMLLGLGSALLGCMIYGFSPHARARLVTPILTTVGLSGGCCLAGVA